MDLTLNDFMATEVVSNVSIQIQYADYFAACEPTLCTYFTQSTVAPKAVAVSLLGYAGTSLFKFRSPWANISPSLFQGGLYTIVFNGIQVLLFQPSRED
jgi:hypothetical protein